MSCSVSTTVATVTYDHAKHLQIIFPHYRPLWHRACSNHFRQHRNVCKTPTATFRLTLHSLLLNAGSSPPAFFYARIFPSPHLTGVTIPGGAGPLVGAATAGAVKN